MSNLRFIVSVICILQCQSYSILPAWALSCCVSHTVLHSTSLTDAAHSTRLYMPNTSISDLMQPDCKPDQSHRSRSVRFQLVNRLHLDTWSDSNLLGCRLSQGWTRTQGRLRPGSQADAASVRSWCFCRGPMQQQRRMMATCWAWYMTLPSTKASSL